MNEILSRLAGSGAVILTMLLVTGGILLVLFLSRRWWRQRYREPFHEPLLRPPGWGCLERRQDSLFDFASIVGGLPVFWLGLAYVIITDRGAVAVGCGLAAVPLTGMGIREMVRHHREARMARLGFLGECAVAEALTPLLSKGWRVFHDVPMEVEGKKFNIDHVAVGPGGVWAIETKTYSKRKNVRGNGDGLKIEGETLVLRDGRRQEPLKQARGCARALQMACNDAATPVRFVGALVVLPGWAVGYPKGASDRIRDPRNVHFWRSSSHGSIPMRSVASRR